MRIDLAAYFCDVCLYEGNVIRKHLHATVEYKWPLLFCRLMHKIAVCVFGRNHNVDTSLSTVFIHRIYPLILPEKAHANAFRNKYDNAFNNETDYLMPLLLGDIFSFLFKSSFTTAEFRGCSCCEDKNLTGSNQRPFELTQQTMKLCVTSRAILHLMTAQPTH